MSVFFVDKLAGILIRVDKRTKEIEETIIQLKSDQSKIRAQVIMLHCFVICQASIFALIMKVS